jgi:hypothetical protein
MDKGNQPDAREMLRQFLDERPEVRRIVDAHPELLDERRPLRPGKSEGARGRQEALAATRPHPSPCSCADCVEWARQVMRGEG